MKYHNYIHRLSPACVALLLVVSLSVAPVAGAASYSDGATATAYAIQTEDGISAIKKGTGVNDCTTIDASGTYYLSSNITNTSAETCFEITASHVHLNGADHRIKGSTEGYPVGVQIRNSRNNITDVSISNITVSNWSIGVEAEAVTNMTISNTSVQHTNEDGFVIRDSSKTTLRATTTAGTKENGIYIGDSEHTTIENTTIRTSGQIGLDISRSQNTTVRNSTILGSKSTGLELWDVRGATLRDVHSSRNSGTGLEIGDSINVTVVDAVTTSNSRDGIEIDATDSVVENTTATGNRDSGFDIEGQNVAITNSTAAKNNFDGFGLYEVSASTIENNSARSNGGAGIDIGEGTGTAILNNTIAANDQDGIGIYRSHHNLFANNTIYQSHSGIGISDAANNTIVDNRIIESYRYGISLRSTSSNTFERNTIVQPEFSAIQLRRGGANNTFENTTIRDPVGWILYTDDGTSGYQVKNLTLGTNKFSFSGTDVAVGVVRSPPPALPEGTESTGPYLRTAALNPDAWLRLSSTFAPAETVNKSSVTIWQYNSTWSALNASLSNNTIEANLTDLETPISPGALPQNNTGIALTTAGESLGSPANITVESYSVSAIKAPVNESISLSVSLSNTGSQNGSKLLTIYRDGTQTNTYEVSVPGNDSIRERLPLTLDQVGTTNVTVNALPATQITVTEAQSPNVTLRLNTTNRSVSPGQRFWVAVQVNATTGERNTSIAGIETKLTYNASRLTATEVRTATYLTKDGAKSFTPASEIDNKTGTVSYAEARTASTGVSGSGELAFVKFVASENTSILLNESLSIGFTDVRVSSPNSTAIATKTQPATLEVVSNQPPALEAEISTEVNNAGAPIQIEITANDMDGTIDSFTLRTSQSTEQVKINNTTQSSITVSGQISLQQAIWNNSANGYEPQNVTVLVTDEKDAVSKVNLSVIVYIPGDTDGDGAVNIFDAVRIGQRWQVSSDEAGYSSAADLNNDGTIDIFDATLVGQNWQQSVEQGLAT
jgi:parallel beta-helix repeat protein